MIPIPVEALKHFKIAIQKGYNDTQMGWGYGKIGNYMRKSGYKLSRRDYNVLINHFDREGHQEREKSYQRQKSSLHPKWKHGFMDMMNSSKKRTLEEYAIAETMSSDLSSGINAVKPPTVAKKSFLRTSIPSSVNNLRIQKDLEYKCLRLCTGSARNNAKLGIDFKTCVKRGVISKNQAFCLGIVPKVRLVGFAMSDGAIFDPIHWGYRLQEEKEEENNDVDFTSTESESKGPFIFSDFNQWKSVVRNKLKHTSYTTSPTIYMFYFNGKDEIKSCIYAISIEELKQSDPVRLKEAIDKLNLIPCVFETSSIEAQDFTYLNNVAITKIKLINS